MTRSTGEMNGADEEQLYPCRWGQCADLLPSVPKLRHHLDDHASSAPLVQLGGRKRRKLAGEGMWILVETPSQAEMGPTASQMGNITTTTSSTDPDTSASQALPPPPSFHSLPPRTIFSSPPPTPPHDTEGFITALSSQIHLSEIPSFSFANTDHNHVDEAPLGLSFLHDHGDADLEASSRTTQYARSVFPFAAHSPYAEELLLEHNESERRMNGTAVYADEVDPGGAHSLLPGAHRLSGDVVDTAAIAGGEDMVKYLRSPSPDPIVPPPGQVPIETPSKDGALDGRHRVEAFDGFKGGGGAESGRDEYEDLSTPTRSPFIPPSQAIQAGIPLFSSTPFEQVKHAADALASQVQSLMNASFDLDMPIEMPRRAAGAQRHDFKDGQGADISLRDGTDGGDASFTQDSGEELGQVPGKAMPSGTPSRMGAFLVEHLPWENEDRSVDIEMDEDMDICAEGEEIDNEGRAADGVEMSGAGVAAGAGVNVLAGNAATVGHIAMESRIESNAPSSSTPATSSIAGDENAVRGLPISSTPSSPQQYAPVSSSSQSQEDGPSLYSTPQNHFPSIKLPSSGYLQPTTSLVSGPRAAVLIAARAIARDNRLTPPITISSSSALAAGSDLNEGSPVRVREDGKILAKAQEVQELRHDGCTIEAGAIE